MPLGRLYQDDVGPGIGEEAASEGRCRSTGELDDPDVFKHGWRPRVGITRHIRI